MTNEYKENVLKYLINILEQQSGNNTATFENIEERANNLLTQLSVYFTNTPIFTSFIASKDINNENLNYSVLVCTGNLVNSQYYFSSSGFAILDENYNLLDFITSYSDGTQIAQITCLNVDDEGNFFGIENKFNLEIPQAITDYYIIELNNMTLKLEGEPHYHATKLKEYQFPTIYDWRNVYSLSRNTSKTKYFAVAETSSGNNDILRCPELTVSHTPTWVYYTRGFDLTFSLTTILNNGYYVYWDTNDELHFYIAANSGGLILLYKGSQYNIRFVQLTEGPITEYSNFIFQTNNIGYYASIEHKGTSSIYKLYKVIINSNNVKLIDTKTYTYSNLGSAYNQMWLFKKDNTICFTRVVYNQDILHRYDLSFGLINDTDVFETSLGHFSAVNLEQTICLPNIINKFNKNYVYIQRRNDLFTLDFNWNNANYNGAPFISSTSLIPNRITVDDENNNELFDRNLYNYSYYANRYIATTPIPNYYLNNETLSTTKLFSKNNNLLVESSIDTAKNIYEEVFINFINKFTVFDKINNYRNYTASSQFVNSMLTFNDSAYISKIKVNYNDETTEIKTLSHNGITNLKTTLAFTIYIDKKIDSIDILSENEEITYKTIDASNLEVGKYYSITHDLRIE